MADCTYTSPDWDDLPEIPDGLTTDVVTEGCVSGNGIYDVFMKAHLDAIHQEYAKQRIKGSEYSKVYLGGMQAAMQNAVGFALGKDEASSKAELAKYAIEKAKADVELVSNQVCKVQKEIELLNAQRELLAAQTWAEIAKTDNNINTRMEELLGINGAPDYTFGTDNVLQAVSVLGSQVELAKQKTVTELAQTNAAAAEDSSLIGKKKLVHQRQADGFLRNAEVAVGKMYADSYAVATSALDLPPNVPEFNDLGIDAAMEYVRTKMEEGSNNPPDP